MKFIEGKIQLKGKWEKFGNRVWINGRELKPDYSQKIWNKSPTGFAWGYLGSGPSQLALAVMLRVLPKHQAIALHQDFKERFIATLPQTDFEIEIDLPGWLAKADQQKQIVQADYEHHGWEDFSSDGPPQHAAS
jgi:hypothetical protein